jgi:cephalosporin hydroxylase
VSNYQEWDVEFTNWKNEILELQSKDQDFKETTANWLQKAVDSKYSYQFEWLGIPIIQFPTDLIVFQEIVWKTKPDLIIETGVARGGSINYWASLQDICDIDGHVLGVDIEIRDHTINAINDSKYKNSITLIQGGSTDIQTFEKVSQIADKYERIMVVLDSNHTHEHVYRELELYANLVSTGCYLLILDTVIDDLNIDPNREWGPGESPKSAVLKFMNEHISIFEADKTLEKKAVFTVAPSGFWIKK